MPRVTIAKCRPFVQELKEFTASTLHGKWERAKDGTRIYVVRSIFTRRGAIRNETILFAYHDGVWCERDGDLPWYRRRLRIEQRYFARPTDQTVRMDFRELRMFVQEGMAHHPKMQRLLAVSV